MTFHERLYAFYRQHGCDHAEAHRHAAADVKWWCEEVFGIRS